MMATSEISRVAIGQPSEWRLGWGVDLLFLVLFTVVGAFTLVLSGCGAPDDGGLFEARPSSTTLRASPSSSSVPADTSSSATAAEPSALPSEARGSGTPSAAPAPPAAPARSPAAAPPPAPVTPADGPLPGGADDSADPEQAEPPAAAPAVVSTIRIDRARWDEEKESLELRGEVSSPVVKLTAEFLDRSATLSNDDGRFRAELTGVRSSPGSVRIVASDGSRADASVEEN